MLTLPKVKEIPGLNAFPVFYWNHVALEMNRITHSLGGPQGGPTMSSRALGLLHLAMHDAFLISLGENGASDPSPYLENITELIDKTKDYEHSGHTAVAAGNLKNANRALTGAAVTMLDILYAGSHPSISIVASDTLTQSLSRMIGEYEPEQIDILHPAHVLGVEVARKIYGLLGVKPGDPGADAGRYEPKTEPYFFRDEPVTPVRPRPIDPNDPSRGEAASRAYHGPLYGITVNEFAVHNPTHHRIADWPRPGAGGDAAYLAALTEVKKLGAAPGHSTRTPVETATGYYWAYDGANLIGTPPRLYNQIIRLVAWSKKNGADDLARTREFVRVLALANVAMADAGKFAWLEKYRFELWRPLSGIREHDGPDADPFWLALGAPETNTNRVSFKPPFPAYPSGHATFGAAAFQMLRLYYQSRDGDPAAVRTELETTGYQTPDALGFEFVSEELNGISRDLRQPYDPNKPIEDQQGTVRTRVKRPYLSLWKAIFDNAFSRIYLGVHWHFDAAAASDIYDGGALKDPAMITYGNVWRPDRDPADLPTGGVPLGLGIANDIFYNGMKIPARIKQMAGAAGASAPFGEVLSKRSNTTYRSDR